KSFIVRSVDVESMLRLEDGSFSRPAITGAPAEAPESTETRDLGTDWTLAEPPTRTGTGSGSDKRV
ncbi:MAG TPA: hypothetical protein VIN33_08155, partial [Marinobacter sp.]